jgi:hypothetical protein
MTPSVHAAETGMTGMAAVTGRTEAIPRRAVVMRAVVATHHTAVPRAGTAMRPAGEAAATAGGRTAKSAEGAVANPVTPIGPASVGPPPIPIVGSPGSGRRAAAIGRAAI